jgi:hypothetical protein
LLVTASASQQFQYRVLAPKPQILIIGFLVASYLIQRILANMIAIAIQTLPIAEMHTALLAHGFSRFECSGFGVVHDLGRTLFSNMRPDTEPSFQMASTPVPDKPGQRKLIFYAKIEIA